nr:hypothetical protein [Candidatus Sigynarchaeota archaeon]
MKKSTIIGYLFLFLVILIAIWYYGFQGSLVIGGIIPPSYFNAMFLIALLIVIYQVLTKFIRFGVLRSKGSEGEAHMVRAVFKFVIIVAVVFVFFLFFGDLGALGGLFALFGGSMLGWSLQAPISGMAAWLMVSIV